MMAMGIGLVAFIGLAGIAVNVGHLAFTANEVQMVADAAATAAAARLAKGAADAIGDGQSVAGQNFVAGNNAPGVSSCPGDSSTCIDIGRWSPTEEDPDTGRLGHFTVPAGPPYNAARATVTVAGVPNLIPALFGATSTVTKVAVAAVRPSLPLVVGIGDKCEPSYKKDASYQQERFNPPNCNVHPTVVLHLGGPGASSGTAGRSDYVGWGNFDYPDGSTQQGGIMPHMPAQCGGGGLPGQLLQDQFNIREASLYPCSVCPGGSGESALFSCWHDSGLDTFVIAFFPCHPNYAATGAAATVGFGVVKILAFDDPAGNPNPTITLELECDAPSQVTLVQ